MPLGAGLVVEGHAIVSADGMIADAEGNYPASLRNDADWTAYQRALDQSTLVVIGRRGHERHANPGRRRLVMTRRIEQMRQDPADAMATFWNPAVTPLEAAVGTLEIETGTLAITGNFAFFLGAYDRFVLSESHLQLIPGGTGCFAAGHPRSVLALDGLRPVSFALIDAGAQVTTTVWERG